MNLKNDYRDRLWDRFFREYWSRVHFSAGYPGAELKPDLVVSANLTIPLRVRTERVARPHTN
jgi:hypothetical protein